jgi:hypothetical protein
MRSEVLPFAVGVLILVSLLGCGNGSRRVQQTERGPASEALTPQSVLPGLRELVQGMLLQHVEAEQAAVLKSLSDELAISVGCRPRLVAQTLTDPWFGLLELESLGYGASRLARAGPAALPALLAALETGMDRAATASQTSVAMKPRASTVEQLIAVFLQVMAEAHRLRDRALRQLTSNEQQLLFDHAGSFVQNFVPHVAALTEHNRQQAYVDRRLCQLFEERVDYAALLSAAQVLSSLADDAWLDTVGRAFSDLPALSVPVEGVTGEVLFVRQTALGRLLVGGGGPNTYTLSQEAALIIIDVGGDDAYVGSIAASTDLRHGLSVVIDLAGNDAYHAAPMGLATGRLGVGLLIDRGGNDLYYLSQGTGGAGFTGVGILYDRSGDDRYLGGFFTQGVAVAGLGLLLDGAGSDRYTSSAYALGFGGPAGIGAVVDVAGDDDYQCGEKIVSDYTTADAPGGKPGDPLYQYDCFGLGMGSGKRVFVSDHAERAYSVAGGLGMLLDLDGNDRYRSANFSQGAGYFFGIGLKLDLAGNDEHAAARFGHASGAHAGVGLFIDAQGEDRYVSSGPTYNGAAAWDRSVMLSVDAGQGDDQYDFRRSNGLGRADHHSWSVFIEEGGRDRYDLASGMGIAFEESMSGFFDLGGEDDYRQAPGDGTEKRGNRRLLVDPAGGLFVDR